MATKVDDVTIDHSKTGTTFQSTKIRSGLGRIFIDAKLNNYGIEKTSVAHRGHHIFLERAALHLREHPADVIELTGFATNDKAGQKYNEAVAMNRAEEAAEYLLRRGVADRQILINRAQVVGQFREQLDSDRRVEAKILEQLSKNFRCRMVKEAATPELGNFPFLVITGNDIDVEGVFWVFPRDDKDVDRFEPNMPSPGGFIKPAIPVSIKDFDNCGVQCFTVPPDMIKLVLGKFLTPTIVPTPANTLSATTFVDNIKWLNPKPSDESFPCSLMLMRTVVDGRTFNGKDQSSASLAALRSRTMRAGSGLGRIRMPVGAAPMLASAR